MVDGQLSAQKAEQIYDKKQVLQSINDHILKLETQQSMDEIQGRPHDDDLETRISAAYGRRVETEARIAQLEAAYQDWMRENP